MESYEAVEALSALAHPGRLEVFRTLVRAGPEGMAAGAVADALAMAPSTLSANLTILGHAGLARSRRQGRSIIYSADFARMTQLVGFLVKDCCQGRAEVCAPLMEAVADAACR